MYIIFKIVSGRRVIIHAAPTNAAAIAYATEQEKHAAPGEIICITPAQQYDRLG